MSSPARVPTLWFGRVGASRSCRLAARLCAKPPMSMAILSKTMSVDSYQRRKGCCVISRQGRRRAASWLSRALCCSQPLSVLTHQRCILVPSAWTLVSKVS